MTGLPSAARRWLALWSAKNTAFASGAVVVLAVACTQALGLHADGRHPGEVTILKGAAAAFFAVLFTLALSIVVGCVSMPFAARAGKGVRFRTIIVSYFCLMFVFASMYHVGIFFADYDQAATMYERYDVDGPPLIDERIADNRRAFGGIQRLFWSSPEVPPENLQSDGTLYPWARLPQGNAIRAIAQQRSFTDVVRFVPGAAAGIFGDALYFSAITITTVGYGDIVPKKPTMRFIAALEALCNPLLLIFGFGIVLSERSRRADSSQP